MSKKRLFLAVSLALIFGTATFTPHHVNAISSLPSPVDQYTFTYDSSTQITVTGTNGFSGSSSATFTYKSQGQNKSLPNTYVLGTDPNSPLWKATPFACDPQLQGTLSIISFVPRGKTTVDQAFNEIDATGGTPDPTKVGLVPQSPYVVIGCGGPGFFKINTIAGAANLSPGSTTGGSNKIWYDTSGTEIKAGSIGDKFRFISPYEIIDQGQTYPGTTKPIVYALIKPSGMFTTSDSVRFINDGEALYWPVKQDGSQWLSTSDNKCFGGFAVTSSNSASDANNGYGTIYRIPTFYQAGGCYVYNPPPLNGSYNPVDFSSPISQYSSAFYPPFASSPPIFLEDAFNITKEMGSDNKAPYNRRMWYASLRWQDPNTIYTLGNNVQLSKLDSTLTQTTLASIGKSANPNTQLWTSDACKKVIPNGPFILLDYDSRSTQTDADTQSTNSFAQVYAPVNSDGTGGWTNTWNGTNLKCLFGNEVKHNSYAGQDLNSYVYISYISKSVGNTAGSLGSDSVTAALSTAIQAQTQADDPLDLQCHLTVNPLTWLICPLITGAVKGAQAFDKGINNVMTIPVNQYLNQGDGGTGQAVYQAWSSIRDIAVALLVIIALVMVISQALNFGPFDAYTVKKILPRILIAIVFMALSWPLLKLAIIFTDDLGQAVRGIILSPFKQFGDPQILGGTGSLLALGVVGGGLALGLIGILSLAVTGFLAGLIAFILLIFRRILVLFLIILAPIAIICSILPGTQKAWKLWHESLIGALLAFPIISAFIAMGHVFAAISYKPNSDILSQFIVFVTYFGPYFLIPTAFKMAGGVFSTVAGMANDRGRGIFDRLKKGRQKRVAQNVADIRSGHRLHGGTKNNFRGKVNRTLQRGALINRVGFNPARWRGRLRSEMSNIGMQDRAKMLEDPDYTWKNDDELNLAAAQSQNEAHLRNILSDRARYQGSIGRANLDKDVSNIEKLRRKYSHEAFQEATFLQSIAGGTADKSIAGWLETAGKVAGDDDALLSDLVAKGTQAGMSAGRPDQVATGFGTKLDTAKKLRDQKITLKEANADIGRKVYDSQGPAMLLNPNVKQTAVENLAPIMVERLDEVLSEGDERRSDQELAALAAVHDNLNSTNPEKARYISDVVMNHLVKGRGPDGSDITVGGLIDMKRNSEAFKQTRREYQTAYQAQANQPPPDPGG